MIDLTSYKTVSVDVENGIATITLNLPSTGNAFDGVMHDELTEALYAVNGDRRVRALILTGAGDNFCAGGDPNYIRELTPDDYSEVFLTVRRLIQNLINLDRPIVAAVNGDAVGVGATVALFCDIIVGADDGVIVDPHVMGSGLAAGDGGALMWALQLGLPRAKYHLFTGRPLAMTAAAEAGLINETTSRSSVLARAQEIAREIADGPGPGMRGTKRIFSKIVESIGSSVIEFAAEQERLSIYTDDHKETMLADLENRSPRYRNT